MEANETRWRARDQVVVVHPDELTRHRLRGVLRGPNRDVYMAQNAKEALDMLSQVEADLVIVSLELPDVTGVRAVGFFREHVRDGIPVIAISAKPRVEEAVHAVRQGAADYVGAETARTELLAAADRALQEARSTKQLDRVRQGVRDQYGFSHLLTQSPRMLQVFDQMRAVASTDATVLILGETGTGKELVSRAVHSRSRRRDKPFISVNCGAFTETLLESELFGHERGSFTGAIDRRKGLFEMADGGTLFLDELGETTLNVQVNLLRVLESMTFRRVGGREEVRVDVRIVAATNVGLQAAIQAGRFREDLFYRLNVFPIELPPLRERREDIPLLMRHFLDEIGLEYELEPPIVSAEALDMILDYSWPGNVRQLRAMCERWVITRSGRRLEREHLPTDMTGDPIVPETFGSFHIDEQREMKVNTDRIVRQVERAYLYKALRRHSGRMDQAATASGISRRTLYTKMKQYGLVAEEFRRR